MPFAEIIRRQSAERPDQIAIRWDGGELTFSEVHERSSRLAQGLIAAGVGGGDRVAIVDMNHRAHLELAYGAAKLGAVAVPINFRLAPAEIRQIVDDAGANVLFVGAEYEGVFAGLDTPATVVALANGYEAWLATHPAEDPGYTAEPAETVYQLYSSGTTGRPKGIELSGGGLTAFMDLFPRDFLLDETAVNVVTLPIFHAGGNGVTFATHRAGGINYLMRQFTPAGLAAVLSEQHATHVGMVPALMQAMLALPDIAHFDFSALRCIPYGGSPIPVPLLVAAKRGFGCEFVQGYGLTETTGGATTLRAAEHDPNGPNTHRLRSVGLPNKDTELRIVDPVTLEDVSTGEVGEVWIRGPQLMNGYWRQPAQTAEAIVDGWLRSGDAGYLDADGYLYLHDRIKDMIVSGGENIYSIEIENALASHAAVADCAVIGVPSERWGETPMALVVRSADVTADALIAHCRVEIARFKCPTVVEWVDELPRNASGKLLKRELRDRYASQTATSAR